MKEASIKRSQRRHEVERLRKKRKNFYGNRTEPIENIGRYLGMTVNTAKPCSCFICGNPRKFYGNSAASKTIHEQSDSEMLRLFNW